jgi:hypothetical protein
LRVGDTLEVRPADEEFDARWEALQQRSLAKSGAG